jgi:ketosteroid isomerase-like protein
MHCNPDLGDDGSVTTEPEALVGLLDEAAIRTLVNDYAEAADRGRSAELADLFAPDGVLEIRGESFDAGVYRGREEIIARLERSREGLLETADRPLLRHHLATVRVRPRGAGTARVEAYFLAVTGAGPDHWGRYSDRVVAVAGDGWRFAHRRVLHEGHAPASWLRRQLDRADQPLG